MTFERLVRNDAFASQTVTTTVGAIGLDRPDEVYVVDAKVNRDRTAELLAEAHGRAVASNAATLIHQLALPFVGFENANSTDVKPDFAVVARTVDGTGSWLVMGDAKDYERHRSRIDDGRLLKGFLQVAVGAESAAAWSQLPVGMTVHEWGALAVPRNAFLQPEALVEDLADHRREVAMRIAERREEAKNHTFEPENLDLFVEHLIATYDPATCPTCSLFDYCRSELRSSTDPADLLVEIGIPKDVREHVIGLVDGTGELGPAAPSTVAQVIATRDGVPQSALQRRVDPIGLPGTVNLVLAKADAAAMGVHGIAVQVITAVGVGAWKQYVFADPQSPETRRAVIRAIGTALAEAMKDRRLADPENPEPIHLIVPDKMTADVIVSIADNLAGLELSRLRWAHDVSMGRPALTFDGEPAQIPLKLKEDDRTAVAFLLEDDRARAMTLRTPIINALEVLNRHHVVGGPAINALRLDYVVAWFLEGGALNHRNLTDEIEQVEHTPGARLANKTSDLIHGAIAGPEAKRDPDKYQREVRKELAYKADILTRAIEILEEIHPSRLRVVHRTIEGDAQAVWQRRLRLHASDLVRFGRTYRWWRNALVEPIQIDQKCREQMLALANPQYAQDLAADAGHRFVAFAEVASLDPLVIDVHSRRIVNGSTIALLHVNDVACFEDDGINLKVQAGAFSFKGVSIGPLTREGIAETEPRGHLIWKPKIDPTVAVGDRLVVADADWFDGTPYGTAVNVKRPAVDSNAAPKPDCINAGFSDDPDAHAYCCKPHEINEAEWADTLADRRAAGLLNPETWPPVRNADAFEIAADGKPQGNPYSETPVDAPADLTEDDLD